MADAPAFISLKNSFHFPRLKFFLDIFSYFESGGQRKQVIPLLKSCSPISPKWGGKWNSSALAPLSKAFTAITFTSYLFLLFPNPIRKNGRIQWYNLSKTLQRKNHEYKSCRHVNFISMILNHPSDDMTLMDVCVTYEFKKKKKSKENRRSEKRILEKSCLMLFICLHLASKFFPTNIFASRPPN